MGANMAGIYGAQIFRQDDRPRYRRAFNVNIGILAFGLSLALARFIDDKFRRRKAPKQSETESESESSTYNDGVLKAAVPADEQPQPIAIGGRRLSLSKADI